MRWRAPVAILVLGLALRLGFLALEPAVSLQGDEPAWVGLAQTGIAKPWKPFAPANRRILFYPPIYPWFLRFGRDTLGGFAGAMGAQAVVGALLAPSILLVGRRLFRERTAVIAAILVAVLPELVWFSTHYWTETLFMVFVWWSFERAVAAMAQPNRLVPALAGGALLGLAALTREPALYFLPVMVALFAMRRENRRQAAVFALATLLTVAPWTYRNYRLFGEFIPVSTSGWFNIWQGNTPLHRDDVYRIANEIGDPVGVWKHARAQALSNIASRQPTWLFEKLRSELPPLLWGPSEPELHLFDRHAYGPVSAGWSGLWRAALAGPYWVLALLASFGLVRMFRRRTAARERLLLPAFIVFYVLVHVASVGSSRYRVPFLPCLALLAAASVEKEADVEG